MAIRSSLARTFAKLIPVQRNRDESLRGLVQNERRDFFDFKIAPALSGYNNGNNETDWNLGTMGTLIIDGSNDGTSYTITNRSSRNKFIQMWGQGASGKGGFSQGTFTLVVDDDYLLRLNEGAGSKSPAPNGQGGNGGGYGGLFNGSVSQANAVIISGGGGGNGGIFSFAAGGAGGGTTGGDGTPGGRGPGGEGGGQSCPAPLQLQGASGGSGGGGSNFSSGGGGGGGYCGGGGGTTGGDPGGGTQPSAGGGGGSGYVNPSFSSDASTNTYPAGASDPNRGTAGDGPARLVIKLPD